MDTGLYVSVDVALIVASLAPTILILVTSWLASRARKRAQAQMDGVHTLVNDQMTREKAARLDDLRTQKIVVERLRGGDIPEADLNMLVQQMEHRIEQLSREVEKRDDAAARVAG